MDYLTLCYITGILCILISLFTYLFPTRKMSLLMKALIDIVSVLNLLFVYLYTKNSLVLASVATTGIGFIRDIVFFFRQKKKWLNNYAWPIGFSIIFSLSLIFTYKGPLSLMPVIGSVISTMSLYAINQKITKCGALCCITLYIIYYGILLEGSGILTLFSLLSYVSCFVGTLVGLIILFKKDKKASTQTNDDDIRDK